MAEHIPFGIAQNLLTKLASSTFQEIGLIYSVKNDLRRLENTFVTIKAVLLDAEKKQANSHAVKSWIKRLQDVVYDADDLLDDMATEGLRRKVEGQGRMNQRYQKELDDVAKDISTFGFISSNQGVANMQVMNNWRETDSFVLKSEFIGREADKEKIIESLLSPNNQSNVSIVAIVGFGGLGKTALAQLVFNDEKVVNCFDLKIWVCISEESNVQMLVKMILKNATSDEVLNWSLEQLQIRLRQHLEGKKYLLVLDDVWNVDYGIWGQLRKYLMVGAIGSKILVTTRSMGIALAMDVDSPYELGKFMCIECTWVGYQWIARFNWKVEALEGIEANDVCPATDDIWILEVVNYFGIYSSNRIQLYTASSKVALPLVVLHRRILNCFYREQKITSTEPADSKDAVLISLSYPLVIILPSMAEQIPFSIAENLITKLTSISSEDISLVYGFKNDLRRLQTTLSTIKAILLDAEEKQEESHAVKDWIKRLKDVVYDVDDLLDDVATEVRSFFQNHGNYYKMHDLIRDLAQSIAGNSCFVVNDTTKDIPDRVQHVYFGIKAKPMKNVGGQVCQICSDNVGKTVDGDPFVACDVCAFPVCRPCYEYERKDGSQSCPQCKTRYKRQKGSPAILADRDEDGDADNGTSDFNYSSETQNHKQKIAERMLSWQMAYGQGEDVEAPNYDKEVSGELSAASPEHISMASPGVGVGKHIHPLPYTADVNQSCNFFFLMEFVMSVSSGDM
ncbi:hypothetical protein GH714_016853 [Hevea brasiliensis]|uniref:RING-type domain-containing protein n=1 Tax=Hevea brasiliensis TaxID=3981 RepID=A0A6A6N2A3_HEVBR|nr:hypothetical protein GH714_016853 [Hevea brasiliensis]